LGEREGGKGGEVTKRDGGHENGEWGQGDGVREGEKKKRMWKEGRRREVVEEMVRKRRECGRRVEGGRGCERG
jgi:hypothetical protein